MRKPILGPTLGPAIAAAIASGLAPGLAQADLINGDFASGDLTGWTTDTDGSGPPSPLVPDFQVIS